MAAVLAAAVLGVALVTGCSTDAPAPSAATSPAASSPAGNGRADAPPYPSLPTWQPVGVLETPRDDFVTAVVDGRIWVLGGMTGDRGNRLTSIEVYDPATRAWTTSDVEMPVGLASFEGVARGSRIFVFGGLDASSRATDFSAVLDTATGKWRRLPPLPHPRYAHTVTWHDGRIYVIGGDAASAVTAVDVFDPRTERWTQGTPMPEARGSHDTVSTPGGLLVLGGYLDGAPTDLVQLYRPRTGRWSIAPPLPEPVSRAGAAFLDGRVWVTYHRFAATLDLGAGQWEPANYPPLSRHGLGLVALGDTLYAVGGCQESPLRDVRTVDALELSPPGG